MATNRVQTGESTVIMTHDISWIQRLMLRRFHPRNFFIGSVGVIWFTYFFWKHDWVSALWAVLITRTLGYLAVLNINTELFAQTRLGKIGLLHLNPFNFVTQLVGTLIILYGLWEHNTELILVGLSLVLIGHIFGWDKVDSNLADMTE